MIDNPFADWQKFFLALSPKTLEIARSVDKHLPAKRYDNPVVWLADAELADISNKDNLKPLHDELRTLSSPGIFDLYEKIAYGKSNQGHRIITTWNPVRIATWLAEHELWSELACFANHIQYAQGRV